MKYENQPKIIVCILAIVITLVFILLLNQVSAIYSGETETLNLSSQLDNITSYSILGNLSEIKVDISDGNNSIAYVSAPEDVTPSSFTITFYGWSKGERVESNYQGGGGYYNPDWNKKKVNQTTTVNQSLPQSTITNESNETKPYSPEQLDGKYPSYVKIIVIVFVLAIILFLIWIGVNRK